MHSTPCSPLAVPSVGAFPAALPMEIEPWEILAYHDFRAHSITLRVRTIWSAVYAVALYVDPSAVKSKLSKYKGQEAEKLAASKSLCNGRARHACSDAILQLLQVTAVLELGILYRICLNPVATVRVGNVILAASAFLVPFPLLLPALLCLPSLPPRSASHQPALPPPPAGSTHQHGNTLTLLGHSLPVFPVSGNCQMYEHTV